ncbi:MAG: DUF5305 family protein, partial [Chloroflexota bacterium]
PTTRAADSIPYQQESNYFYSATGTPGVYDTEFVRSGEPVFPKLTCFLNIGLTYSLLGNEFSATTGTYQMNARVMDDQSGWQRTIPLVPQTSFVGNSYLTMATLDVCQVQSLVALVEQETGMRANAYTVEILTDVAFTTSVAGQTIGDIFTPALTFKLDKVHLYLANQNAEVDPLHTSKQGLAGSTHVQTNTLPLLGWEPTVQSVRVVSLLGLAFSLIALAVVGLYVYNTARESQEARIRLRYGTLLMDVYERSLDATLPMIDVASIDDLAKMAERQNTMILHMTLNFLHYYLVQSNGAVYRYVVTSGKRALAEPEMARQEILAYPVSGPEHEVSGYVVDASSLNPVNNQFVETEILKKIRL